MATAKRSTLVARPPSGRRGPVRTAPPAPTKLEYLAKFRGSLLALKTARLQIDDAIESGEATADELPRVLDQLAAAHHEHCASVSDAHEGECSRIEAEAAERIEEMAAQRDVARETLAEERRRAESLGAQLAARLASADRDAKAALERAAVEHRRQIDRLDAAHQSDLARARNEATAAAVAHAAAIKAAEAEIEKQRALVTDKAERLRKAQVLLS